MLPSVEIACDVFEDNQTEVKLVFPEASFDVHLRRFPSEGTQNLEVPLYCAIGYVLTLPRSPGEVEALFKRGAEYHCEGCMSDITSTVRRRPALRKRSE